MRFVILFVLAVAGFMAWKALQPECSGGQVVSIEEADGVLTIVVATPAALKD